MSNPPVWLNEGLAEFYSTFRLMSGEAGADRPGDRRAPAAAEELRPRAARGSAEGGSAVAALQQSARASVFYAESWALTHMVLNGEPSRVTQLSAYLRSVANGVPESRAWEETFGTARMEQDLQQYLQRNLFNTVPVEFTEKITSLPVAPVPVSPGDVEAYLGAYFVQRGQYRRSGRPARHGARGRSRQHTRRRRDGATGHRPQPGPAAPRSGSLRSAGATTGSLPTARRWLWPTWPASASPGPRTSA